MSNKGDLNIFNNKQKHLICDVLKKLNYEENEIVVECIGKPGDNMASDVRILKVNDNNTNIFNMIVKLNPYSNKIENPISNMSRIFFSNEIIMFNDILKTMENLQTALPEDDKLKIINSYDTISEPCKEMILLEYISNEDYNMLDKFEPLSHETVELVLKNLAKYHSLSYALKNKDPELFSEYCEKLTCMYTIEENIKNASAFVALGEDFSKIFIDTKYKEIVKRTFAEQIDESIRVVEIEKKSKYSVIIHGDCWTNNILFRMKDGVPNGCILIDYQLAREALPVADILNLIFTCTSYKTRTMYYYTWIDYYYAQLDKSLTNFGLDINEIYPRELLDADLKRYSKISLGIAMFAASVVLRESNESAKMKDNLTEVKDYGDMFTAFKASDLNKESILKVQTKVEGLIDSCIEFGYLT